MDAGQPGRRRARMIAAAVALGVRLQMRQAGENIELALQFFQRLQIRRELESGANFGGLPLVEDDSVRNVNESQPRSCRRLRRESRNHRIQHRQRQRGAQAL